jgi:hypothetical protein
MTELSDILLLRVYHIVADNPITKDQRDNKDIIKMDSNSQNICGTRVALDMGHGTEKF